MIGNVISSYKIMAKLGEGAMGTVYKGLDYMLEREVAVKVLRPELGRHPDLVERFRTEAVTLARLQHANIATLYIFLRQGDDYFMVMEYVPAGHANRSDALASDESELRRGLIYERGRDNSTDAWAPDARVANAWTAGEGNKGNAHGRR